MRSKLQPIQLGGNTVGPDQDPFIIAEVSCNHGGSIDQALELIGQIAEAGAHAVKFQTYTPDTMTLDVEKADFVISDDKSLWKGYKLYDLYKEAYTPWEWHSQLFEKAREFGLSCFSTPFDPTAVDFLEGLDMPFYKIASFENTDRGLLKKVASTGKPIIMSTGTTFLDELVESVEVLREAGCKDLILLKCTSAYPADPKESNLATIPHMRELFGCQIGLSDHTMGIGVAVASVALGATVIEKHVRMPEDTTSHDADFSITPDELKSLVVESKAAAQAIGSICYQPSEEELKSRKFKRSLYFTSNMKKGDKITDIDVKAVRPGHGLQTKYLDKVLGKYLAKDVSVGDPVSFDCF